MRPLADRIRPQTLDEMVGQRHLLGEGKPLRRILASGVIPNLIFYGPSGVGIRHWLPSSQSRPTANSAN